MDVSEKMGLINRWPTEEVLTEADLKKLLESGVKLNHYFGIEISGQLHLGQGIGLMMKVADLQKAGVNCSVYLADWHSLINNKLDGKWENIQKGSEYVKEILIAGLKCVGGDHKKVKFVKGSELYNNDYWMTVIDVSKNISINRIMRSISIMGREEKDVTTFAQLMYPPMQAADIFFGEWNIAHGGMDQRKIHVIAREVAESLHNHQFKNKKDEVYKPIALHTHLWLGLLKPKVWPVPENLSKEEQQEIWTSMKMSKSKPNTAIFLTDTPEEIKAKIKDAFCPEKTVNFNPLLDWAKTIVFYNNKPLMINRPEKFGGNITFKNYEELEKAYTEGKLHPMDLKNAMAEFLINFLAPAREHFKDKEHLLKMMKDFMITR